MFTGDDLSTAFSGQTLAAGLSGGVCFFVFGTLVRSSIGGVVIGNGVLAIASYTVIMMMVDRNRVTSWGSLLTCRFNDPEDEHDYTMLEQPLSTEYNVLVEEEELR